MRLNKMFLVHFVCWFYENLLRLCFYYQNLKLGLFLFHLYKARREIWNVTNSKIFMTSSSNQNGIIPIRFRQPLLDQSCDFFLSPKT